MAEVMQIFPVQTGAEDLIHQYPPEARYRSWGLGSSIGFHLAVVLAVAIAAYLNHIRSFADLMGGMTANTVPADQIEIILPPDDDVPPPTSSPEFVIQKIIAVIPPPPPPPKPKPKPKQATPMIAPHTVVRQETHAIALGSSGFPIPRYPPDARHQHIEGTVLLKVEFDGSGNVGYVGVVQSSGSNILDDSACESVANTWHKAEWANKSGTVPIQYHLSNH